jgi:hypothetical protein
VARAEYSLNLGVKNQWSMLNQYWQRLAKIINGQIGFGNGVLSDNIDGAWANATTGAANTDFTLAHNLGRLPVGYLLAKSDVGTVIYDGSIPATKTQITLKATGAAATIRVFIF